MTDTQVYKSAGASVNLINVGVIEVAGNLGIQWKGRKLFFRGIYDGVVINLILQVVWFWITYSLGYFLKMNSEDQTS